MAKVSSYRFKLVSLLFLIVITTSGHRCGGDMGEVDQTQPDGGGYGDYYIYYASVPAVFDCNSGSILQVQIAPKIDPSYQGFNRVFFTLEGPGGRYRSNYVDFYSTNINTQLVEFGGSIQGGTYWATAYMANIQKDCGNDSDIFARANFWMGAVQVTSCAAPQKTMTIECAYQASDTSVLSTYNVFESPDLADQIDIAFNAASTTYGVYWGQRSLPAELITNSIGSAREYIGAHKATMEMFLCGVKGFKDGSGNYYPKCVGFSVMDTITFIPNAESGSLVGVKSCMFWPDSLEGCNLYDFINTATIHELGHQRAVKSHSGHGYFCVMNETPIVSTGSCILSRLWNPHFCDSCITLLEGISWKEGS